MTTTRIDTTFATARILASRLVVLDRQITSPNDPRWEEFWQTAAQLEAVESSVRRETGIDHCIFGVRDRCPETLPVNCSACSTGQRLEPVRVIAEWVEIDEDGRRWDHMELDL